MRLLLLTLIMSLFIACNNSNVSTGKSASFTGFEMIDLAGGGQKALKADGAHVPIEDGFVMNGKKTGVWRTFYDDGKIKTLTHYMNGLKNGPYYEFTNRGQIELSSEFLNDKQNGKFAKYKFGRAIVETDYVNGLVHGVHKEYFQNKENLQKEVHFKNGKQDGKLIYYNEEGNVTLEYDYKDGEKVGGGIIEK